MNDDDSASAVFVDIVDFNGEIFENNPLKKYKCRIYDIDVDFKIVEVHSEYIIFDINMENAYIRASLDLCSDIGQRGLAFLRKFKKEMNKYKRILRNDLRVLYYRYGYLWYGITKSGTEIRKFFIEKNFNLDKLLKNPNNLILIESATIKNGKIDFPEAILLLIDKEFLINNTIISNSDNLLEPLFIGKTFKLNGRPVYINGMKDYIFEVFEEHLEEFKQYEGFDRWCLSYEVNKEK